MSANKTLGLSGRLEAVPLSDILQVLSRSEMSGQLLVERDDPPQRGELRLEKGKLVGAQRFPVPEPLGAVLLRQSALRADVLGEALRRQSAAAQWQPLGQVLLDMEALDLQQLESAISEHIQQVACSILAWDRGVYRFFVEPKALAVEHRNVDVSLDASYLVMEAARRHDETAVRGSNSDG